MRTAHHRRTAMSGPPTGSTSPDAPGANAGAGRFGWRWVVPVAVVVVAFGPWFVVAGDVPDPLATHFGPSGRANGDMGQGVAAAFLLAFVGAALAWLVWAQRRGPRSSAIFAAYFAGLLADASLVTAAANRGVDRWEDATLAWGWVVVVTASGLPFAALAGWLQPPDASRARPAPAEPLPLAPTELVMWIGRARAASAEDLVPMEWGGWGYRGSLRLAQRAAWVLRGGEALILDLEGDRRFAVTVDDAPEAASVVNGLLARHPPS